MKKYIPLVIMLLIVVSLQATYWALVSDAIPAAADQGVFGDMFGGITALFSGLAFAGMIYAIILQSNELALQREELSLTRNELVAARKEQEKSAKAQAQLVEKQVINSQIQGLSAIVQGRYQYIAAWGINADRQTNLIKPVEKQLVRLIEESGLSVDKFDELP